jgi:tetratricopeptide (TPR) repeat protein
MKRRLGRAAMAAGLLAAVVFAGRALERRFAARTQFAEGQQALKRHDFAQAGARFQAALEIDPGSTSARLNLAAVYAAQYVPGGESQRNLDVARHALDEFHHVLLKDPGNRAAIQAIAAIYDGQVNYDEARAWYRRLVALPPPSADAYHNLSLTSWKQVSAVVLDARAREGLQPDDGRLIPDSELRRSLRSRWSSQIDDGIEHASKAITIDPEHDAAMTTLSAWHRIRADLADTIDAHQQNVQVADAWIHKALAIRSAKAARTGAVKVAASK